MFAVPWPFTPCHANFAEIASLSLSFVTGTSYLSHKKDIVDPENKMVVNAKAGLIQIGSSEIAVVEYDLPRPYSSLLDC